MNRWITVLVVLALAAIVLLFVRIAALQEQLDALGTKKEVVATKMEHGAEDHEEVEVAHNMARMHLHYRKLWAGLQAGNTDLAAFYAHEIEEEMEAIEEAGIVDDGHDLSAGMRTYGLPPLKAIRRALVEGSGDTDALFDALRKNCNACHTSSGYGYIRIAVPTTVPQGQEFAVEGGS